MDARSSPGDKVAIFRTLFAGREDVYATRWESSRASKAGWSPALVGGPANARKPDRAYLPLTDAVIEAHLSGRLDVGLYPLLRDDSSRLLACDFDGSGWALDAWAYLDAARAMGLDGALERSRSGNGAHVWMFFAGPVPASSARRIGAHLLREAMTVRAELDLASYDRLFPAQDFVPRGSFGNLIALPLQGRCRRGGTTVFLDDALEPFDDQWAFLSGLRRTPPEVIRSLAEQLRDVPAGPLKPSYRRPFRGEGPKPPATVAAVAAAMLEVDRIGLPPALVSSLKHLASLHNPEYYEKERLRFSTWDTPRLIRCYEETVDRLLLPRGRREPAASLVEQAGSHLEPRIPNPGKDHPHATSFSGTPKGQDRIGRTESAPAAFAMVGGSWCGSKCDHVSGWPKRTIGRSGPFLRPIRVTRGVHRDDFGRCPRGRRAACRHR